MKKPARLRKPSSSSANAKGKPLRWRMPKPPRLRGAEPDAFLRLSALEGYLTECLLGHLARAAVAGASGEELTSALAVAYLRCLTVAGPDEDAVRAGAKFHRTIYVTAEVV